jgi:hypothetical protein
MTPDLGTNRRKERPRRKTTAEASTGPTHLPDAKARQPPAVQRGLFGRRVLD